VTDSTRFEVGAGLIPIPDGFDEKQRLRLSLVVGINHKAQRKVDLARWPAAIAELAGARLGPTAAKLQVVFFDAAGKMLNASPLENYVLHPSISMAKVQARADCIWAGMFPASELPVLHTYLKEKSKPAVAAKFARACETGQYRAAQIIETVSVMRATCIAMNFQARLIANEYEVEWRKTGGPVATGQINVGHKQAYAAATVPFRFLFDRTLLNALSRPVAGKPPAEQRISLMGAGAAHRVTISYLTQVQQKERVLKHMESFKMSARAKRLLYPPEEEETGRLKAARAFPAHQTGLVRQMVEALLLEGPLGSTVSGALAAMSKAAPGLREIEAFLSSSMSVAVGEFLATFGAPRPPQAMIDSALEGEARRAADEAARADDIHAKFTGINSRPTLAKLLNFTVDIAIPVPPGLPPLGYVQVYFAGEDAASIPLVAYRYGAESGVMQFRPGSAKEPFGPTRQLAIAELSLPLKHGMVDLAPERFLLSCVDVHSLVNSSRVRLQELNQAELNATDNRETSPRLMEERSRGIQLIDEDGMGSAIARQLYEAESGRALIYAEELVTGYRVFVRRTSPAGKQGDWRSLMARRVTYDPIGDAYSERSGGTTLSWKPYAEFAEREHGAFKPLPRAAPNEQKTGDRLIAPSHLFTWFGETMGVPAKSDGEPLTCEESARERRRIGIGITYDYPGEPKYRVPALRVENSYEFALAPVYLHGGGPTLDQLTASSRAEKQGLVDPKELPRSAIALFTRPSDVQAPLLLVGPGDRLISGNKAKKNEHIERIVLRSGAGEDTDEALRYLVPPRIDFTTAEQYGLLDASSSDRPRGALDQFDQDKDSGDFVREKARNSDKDELYVLRGRRGSRPRISYFPDPMARNLGVAFERDERTPVGFPDRAPSLSFWRAGQDGSYRACLRAVPIELSFQRWNAALRGARILQDGYRSELESPPMTVPRLTIQLAPAEEVTLWTWCWPDLYVLAQARPALAAQLIASFMKSATQLARDLTSAINEGVAPKPPAGVLPLFKTMETEGAMTPDQARASQWLWHRLATDVHRGLGDKQDAKDPLSKLYADFVAVAERMLFHKLPLNGVTGWRKIRLVHAVAKPRWLPSVQLPDRTLSIVALRLLPGVSMADHLKQVPADKLSGSDQPGGSKIFFAGAIRFDRASIRSIRVEGSWPQLDHALAIRKDAKPGGGELYVDRPPRADQVLFDLRDIPRDSGSKNDDLLDLLHDENGQLRELISQSQSAGASATAARRIDLRIVATSRFNEDFTPESPGRGAETLGKFEVETRSYRRPGGTASASTTYPVEILLKATVRPPPPVVTKYEFIAPEQRQRISRDYIIVRKHYFPRLYLDDSWRVSGPDELLAIAFAPAGVLGEDRHYDPSVPVPELATGPLQPGGSLDPQYADEFARFLAKPDGAGLLPRVFCDKPNASTLCDMPRKEDLPYITRWGADPTAAPMGRMEALISPERFSGHVGSLSSVTMPLPTTLAGSTKPEERMAVSVLLYKPQLEASTGRWYVDIGIDPGAAHAPFVRLALARYQPDAIRNEIVDLRMSPPLLLDPLRIPASRTVEVRYPVGKPIVATVYGVGHLRREPDGVVQGVRHLIDMPLQSMELMRMTDAAPHAWLPVHGHDGAPLRNGAIQPVPLGPMLHWRHQFEPPPATQVQRYALVIDEVEMHIPDSEFDKTIPSVMRPANERQVPTLVAQPGFFSMTIELDAL
jgi:hypothetical protein